jgi:hypothetical protein
MAFLSISIISDMRRSSPDYAGTIPHAAIFPRGVLFPRGVRASDDAPRDIATP